MSLQEQVDQSISEEEKTKYTVLMTFPVYATHETTVWASSKNNAEAAAQHLENDEWSLVECNPNKIVIDGFPEYEVLEAD